MTTEILKWLKAQSISVSSEYLRKRLESHPDYPSLVAVQDTLEELGISAYACHGTKEELQQENKPFLAHFNYGGGDIRFFSSLGEAVQKVKEFDKYWSGHVMFMDKPLTYGNADHDKLNKQEKLNRFYAWFAFVLTVVGFMGVALWQNNIPVFLLAITNTIGLGFGWLIAQKEFGISNSVTDKICSFAKHSRCEAVILSKGAKLFNWLTWGDVGIIYFSTSLLFLLYSLLTLQPVYLYYFISLAGLVFPFYSVYYQWRVVKQWCMLCLGVLAVLITGGVISLFNLSTNITYDYYFQIIVFTSIGLFTLAVWQMLKLVILKMLKSTSFEIHTLRSKRNPQIMNALLEKQVYKEENLPEADEAIVFCNSNAPYKIVIACNPYCGPCAKAHHAVEALYEKYTGRLQVAIRFALEGMEEADKKTEAAISIIRAARNKPFEAVRDWYRLFDINKFAALHTPGSGDVSAFLRKHIDWGKSAAIQGTPTFFVNGKQLPEMCSWVDYLAVLEYELKNAS